MLFIRWQMGLFSMNHPGSFRYLATVLVSTAPCENSSLAEWDDAGRNPARTLTFACARRAKFELAEEPALVFLCEAFPQHGLLGRCRKAWAAPLMGLWRQAS